MYTRVFGVVFALDLLFAGLVVPAYLTLAGAPGWREATPVIAWIGAGQLAKTVAWALLDRRLLGPVERWRRLAARDEDGGDDALARAAAAAYRFPLPSALFHAGLWGLVYLPVTAGLAGAAAPPFAPGPHLVEATIVFAAALTLGAFAIRYTLNGLLVLGATAALSSAAQARGLPVRARGASLRFRLVALALALALTPLFWLASLDVGRVPVEVQAVAVLLFGFVVLLWAPICAGALAAAVAAPARALADAVGRIRTQEDAARAGRVPVHSADELGELAEGVNRMMDALEAAAARAEEDRAALERAAAEQARLYDEARAAVAAREEFLSIASHEIRTPLTALQLRVQSLARAARRRGAADDRDAASLRAAADQAARIARLVDNLLDLSRLRAGRLELAPERIDLAALAAEVVDRLRDTLDRAGCAVAVSAPAPVEGTWDRLRLEQVLANLLANAARHAAGAPVEVSVESTPDGARLVVADRGPGIPPETLPRIFDKFERGERRGAGGLGLGLHIGREIARAHGGDLRAENRPGGGAAFVLDLPRP